MSFTEIEAADNDSGVRDPSGRKIMRWSCCLLALLIVAADDVRTKAISNDSEDNVVVLGNDDLLLFGGGDIVETGATEEEGKTTGLASIGGGFDHAFLDGSTTTKVIPTKGSPSERFKMRFKSLNKDRMECGHFTEVKNQALFHNGRHRHLQILDGGGHFDDRGSLRSRR